jgi:hypothetical protein
LSAYSSIYQEYKFKKIDILLQSNQPTTATGEIMAAAVYDSVGDGETVAPSNTVGMMRNISSTMANVYSDCSLQFLGSLNRLPRYLNGTAVAANDEVGQGALFVATEGVVTAAAEGLGYVVCEYEVEFFAPR